ncbi:hypothetical protein GAY31_11390 [Azospirillum brasilense]|nr:hypothetical protein [Azospirillum brasilense]
MSKEIRLNGVDWQFKTDVGDLLVKKSQVINDGLIEFCKEARLDSNRHAGDMHLACSVPTIVVEKWLREGFDIYAPDVTAAQIVARLKRENLDAFVATNKRL